MEQIYLQKNEEEIIINKIFNRIKNDFNFSEHALKSLIKSMLIESIKEINILRKNI